MVCSLGVDVIGTSLRLRLDETMYSLDTNGA